MKSEKTDSDNEDEQSGQSEDENDIQYKYKNNTLKAMRAALAWYFKSK